MSYYRNGTYPELRIILQHVKSLLDLSAPSNFIPEEKRKLSSWPEITRVEVRDQIPRKSQNSAIVNLELCRLRVESIA